MNVPCPFCSPAPEDIVVGNLLCYARYGRFPVRNGHILIIPFRHATDFFTLTPDERTAAFVLLWQAHEKLGSEFHPDGYNLGVNVGPSAGQTIMHAHIHLIPRYSGDVPDPRGGVRFVIPEKARY